MSEKPWKPDRKELEDSVGKTIPDIIARNLDILFCGINPGLYSAAVKHHFARPGNRFWPLLHLSGFTPQVLSPFEDDLLLSMGIGITNLVARATATAAELGREELRDGFRLLEEKVKRTTPKVVAILGVGAYRVAFSPIKKQPWENFAGENDDSCCGVFQPSGINANYQMKELVVLFRRLYNFAKHPL